MTDTQELYAPLPSNVADFVSQRKTGLARTLNDLVEEAHLALYEDENYLRFLNAVYDGQAVEGSLAADNFMAAQIIRNWAHKNGKGQLSREHLAPIVNALGVVLRRYRLSRKERRNMLDGKIIEGSNGE
jgi:hypothetical protein